ncbi:hypothetical protein DID77_01810 [Candidatus Marinamargulisbacteria bacterium SCGC AG-439-L15]|nr:hypothetical protein DID77_01810 [Candidatus Marinamargulisbacteria bacterium SCGC AG-439-L15]
MSFTSKIKRIGFCTGIVFFTLTQTAFAEKLALSAKYIQTEGFVTYQIGNISGAPWFPLSELEFPIDGRAIELGISKRLPKTARRNEIVLRGSVKTNLSDPSGKMEDRDWVYSPGNQLDIYTESEAELKQFEFNFGVDYFLKSFYEDHLKLWFGSGITYQRFLYKVYGADGFTYATVTNGAFNPRLSSPLTISSSGHVLNYDITYIIPYLEGRLNYEHEKISLQFSLGFSPLVFSYDEDEHLVRDPPKTAEGTSTGTSVSLGAFFKYKLNESVFVTADYSYLSIQTEGDQEQFVTSTKALIASGIDYKTKSEHSVFKLGIGSSF